MAVFIVTYDLRKPGRNYDDLYEAIERYDRCHALESSWFIDTSDTPGDIRDHLCGAVDANDQIYVIQLERNWGACRTEECANRLNHSDRTW